MPRLGTSPRSTSLFFFFEVVFHQFIPASEAQLSFESGYIKFGPLENGLAILVSLHGKGSSNILEYNTVHPHLSEPLRPRKKIFCSDK